MLKAIKHIVNLARHQFRDLGVATRRSGQWPTVEKSWLEEHPTCAICGDTKRIQVHHIVPFSTNPRLELDKTNLLSACMGKKECHLIICHGDNFRKYCEDVRKYAEIIMKDPSRFDEIAALAKASAKPNEIK